MFPFFGSSPPFDIVSTISNDGYLFDPEVCVFFVCSALESHQTYSLVSGTISLHHRHFFGIIIFISFEHKKLSVSNLGKDKFIVFIWRFTTTC